jgi:hypothetical protein
VLLIFTYIGDNLAALYTKGKYMLNLHSLKLTCAAVLLLWCMPAVADTDNFIDHVLISPGKSVAMDYAFPSLEYSMYCWQAAGASQLGSVEWKFQNNSFKNQIAPNTNFTLIQSKSVWTKKGETADTSGTLVFTNLDTTDMYVSCRYFFPEADSVGAV